MGPLLFNLYVKYLCTGIDSNVTMIRYADDCLVFAFNVDEKLGKHCLESNTHNLANYFKEHHLNLNSSKTEFVYFSKRNDQRNKPQDTKFVDNKFNKKSNEYKYLGLTIDRSLSCIYHVNQTLKKVAQMIRFIDSI